MKKPLTGPNIFSDIFSDLNADNNLPQCNMNFGTIAQWHKEGDSEFADLRFTLPSPVAALTMAELNSSMDSQTENKDI